MGLKAELDGEIEVGGPDLARSLTDLCLVDEYQLYLHPVVLGRGKPFFAGPRPPLPPCGQRSDCRGRDQVDLRSRLIARLTPTNCADASGPLWVKSRPRQHSPALPLSAPNQTLGWRLPRHWFTVGL